MERITFNKSVSGAVLHAWATEFNRAHREAPNSASRSRLRFVALFTFAALVFLAGRAFAETNADAPTGKPDAVIDLATKEGVDFVKGQWRYSDTKIIGNTWRTDDVLNMLDKMNAIEEVIAVGIHPHDWMNEYTMPGYEDYGRFLVERLKPLIDGKYRTLTGPTNTTAMGSSLGGVSSFYLGWQWPKVFGKVACLSSTFTYRDNLLDRVSSEPKRKIQIYLDSGWPGDNYEATRSMRDRLIWKGYRPCSELFYLAFPEAKHGETAWAARSPIPFQFLFGKVPVFSKPRQPRSGHKKSASSALVQSSGFQRRLRK